MRCVTIQRLYHDRSVGWPLGGGVTIQSLYRYKRTAWLWACHDTIDCIVTRGREVWPLAMSQYNTARVAIRQVAGLRYSQGRATQGHDKAAKACDTAGRRVAT